MINFTNRYLVLLFFITCTAFMGACKKENWNQHNELISQSLDRNLLQEINSNPELSTFSEFLKQTGYADTLQQSKPYTVWAPSNKALESLDQAVVNNPEKLKKFVSYHISRQSYFTTMPQGSLKIKTLSGKSITFTSTKFEEASITSANSYVTNGVLHVVNQAIEPKLNAAEYMLSLNQASKQSSFIQALFHTEMDTSKAVKLYNDPITRKPVYQDGTTFAVTRNHFYQKVSDITSEDSLCTYLILTDAAYEAEKDKLRQYYNTGVDASTDTATQWSIIRDLVFSDVYSVDDFASPVTAISGVKIRVNKNDIVETRQLSNGVAYVVNKIDYDLMENKIPTVTIQGEFVDSLRVPSSATAKIKRTPSGELYADVQATSITSSPDPLYYFRYKTTVNSVKYKVYWRAINDIYTSNINMKVDFGLTSFYPKAAQTPLATTGYKSVAPVANNPAAYQDALVGEYDSAVHGTLYAFLVSSLGATSAAPTALTLDYIKLVPVN